MMETRIDEIGEGIYRLSTLVPDVAPPVGFTFNQFLIVADEPLLFQCGPRAMFPLVSAAVANIMPVEKLRWISFGHIEADECGAMNLWLAAAPEAQIVYSELGCQISVNDLADRPPRALPDGEVLDLGGKRVRLIATPHVPHGWEAQVLYEELTETLFCGDLFTHVGDKAPITTDNIVEPGDGCGGHVSRHEHWPDDRTDHPHTCGATAAEAGGDARLIFRGRRGPAAEPTGRPL